MFLSIAYTIILMKSAIGPLVVLLHDDGSISDLGDSCGSVRNATFGFALAQFRLIATV